MQKHVKITAARGIVGGVLISAGLVGCTASGGVAESSSARWEVVWSDEFSGNALDRSKWLPEESCWGGGNNERQCYTDRPVNVSVADGKLKLTAIPEEFTGPMYPEGLGMDGPETGTQAYTSGKVRTRGLHAWKYGRFSARMKLPKGQGTWPAFWMMPEADHYGTWPLSGEIDIMEATNLGTPCDECQGGFESRTSAALHFGDHAPDNTYLFHKTEARPVDGPGDGWHTYTVEWADGVIQWFVDDEILMRVHEDQWFTGSNEAREGSAAPFDQPFYMMINLAVGGRLAEESNGRGFDPQAFPAEVLVDWVRVEQCVGDEETGRACLSDQAWNGQPRGPWEPEKQ
ncbi:glycoside hydrolase family 16 protein [Parvularcula lutaonensis]|uniref:Glycoside hydrolase family 16 protein n=1 Tax=Parvularcula lutaonensis TaxID=491923 RepID=A0ABV7MAS3_9PROT|nr:glycoside hydrolase family 16 protein [Parvularcula lutaonensis]GGY37880.1 beta-glucanase [Parvularcula lutaonensis]